jgi:hypothetical protein
MEIRFLVYIYIYIYIYVVSLPHRPPFTTQEEFMMFISVKGQVDLRAAVRLE